MAITNARQQEIRRDTEQALKRMARIVESSDDAIIGKTLEGIIVSWNQGAERIYGYQENEVLGRSASFLTPADQPNELSRLLEKVKDGQSADQAETIWLTKDGRLLNVSLQVSPIRDDLGRIVGASSIARDITTEKQKIEQERRALETQLQQSQKLESVGRLAGGVAHDFNNMLAVIIGYTELILDETPPNTDIYQSLEEIFQAAERAKGLTRQLLAFARKQVLEMTTLNINTVITDFSKMIKRLIGEDVTIKLLLQNDLPDIIADSAMMEQILMNLAVNARDAMPDGGILTIETREVSLEQGYAAAKIDVIPGDYLMLAVTDTGHGMDEQTRERIFEPFFTTKESGKGTGLGLSTVYGIAKQHGGHIWVYSEPGYGTIFKIYFPLSHTEVKTRTKQVDAAPIPAQGETILVVEDETKLRAFFCSVLSKLGYRVLSAESPAEARLIGMQHQGHIDLMLTDVVMPEMNGKALYEILAPYNPDMQVVFMSGYTENVIAQRGVLQEGINFIQKPFSINQLAAKLSSVLAFARQSSPKH
jgi:PAS domain S-box-containing protein